MSVAYSVPDWLETVTTSLVAASLASLLAGLLALSAASAQIRRSLWRAGLVAVALMALAQATGMVSAGHDSLRRFLLRPDTGSEQTELTPTPTPPRPARSIGSLVSPDTVSGTTAPGSSTPNSAGHASFTVEPNLTAGTTTVHRQPQVHGQAERIRVHSRREPGPRRETGPTFMVEGRDRRVAQRQRERPQRPLRSQSESLPPGVGTQPATRIETTQSGVQSAVPIEVDAPPTLNRPTAVGSGETDFSTPSHRAGEWSVTAARSSAGTSPAGGRELWWPGVVSGVGTLLLVLRWFAGVVALARLRARLRPLDNPVLEAKALTMLRRLGGTERVALLHTTRLSSPLAFGALRPAIVLPDALIDDSDLTRRDAMLAHELAHVVGRDSLWASAAELLVALLWWNPAVWWIRHRLRLENEYAADEATALVTGGPHALAASLVDLGARLARAPRWSRASLGAHGFRSSLGKRVQRLLGDRPVRWQRAPLFPCIVRTSGLVAAIAIATTASVALWATPTFNPAMGDPDMPTRLGAHWKRSLAGIVLSSALTADPAATNLAQENPSEIAASADRSDRIGSTGTSAARPGTSATDSKTNRTPRSGYSPLPIPGNPAEPDEPAGKNSIETTVGSSLSEPTADPFPDGREAAKPQEDVTDLLTPPVEPLPSPRPRSGGWPADPTQKPAVSEGVAGSSRPQIEGYPGLDEPRSFGSGSGLAIDVVQLATKLTDALGELEIARLRLPLAEKRHRNGVVPAEELQIANLQHVTAQRKVDLLIRMARTALRSQEAALEQAMERSSYLRRLVEVGQVSQQEVRRQRTSVVLHEGNVGILREILRGVATTGTNALEANAMGTGPSAPVAAEPAHDSDSPEPPPRVPGLRRTERGWRIDLGRLSVSEAEIWIRDLIGKHPDPEVLLAAPAAMKAAELKRLLAALQSAGVHRVKVETLGARSDPAPLEPAARGAKLRREADGSFGLEDWENDPGTALMLLLDALRNGTFKKKSPLIIRFRERTPVDKVVRVLDALRGLGAENISLEAIEPGRPETIPQPTAESPSPAPDSPPNAHRSHRDGQR